MNRGTQLVLSLALVAALAVGALTFLSESRSPAGPQAAAGRAEPAFDPGASPDSTDYDARLRELAKALEHEREERTQLAAEVESLKGELARVQQQSGTTQTAHASAREHQGKKAGKEGAREGPRPLDVDALVAAGFSEETVREFKAGVDQMELDRLYLRDIASREGWLDTPRFREESEALRFDMGSTREEYGEEFYDWMLYTTGHPNRVEVGDIMTGSAAENVGLRPGDQVLSYDGQRVFSPSELRDATIEGEVGHLTPVEVLRNGRLTRLMVPRGPLGIRVDMATVEPKPAG